MTGPAVAARTAALARLASESFDVLVVGGGITGAGVALDAASRGLRTALVERDDIASGTSSRSSKLIHGGLRYLEQLQFRLVRQALAERRRLLRLAPHLVRIEPFLVPVHGSPLSLGYIGAGLALYDLLGARHDGGRTRFLTAGQVRRRYPALRSRGLAGGLVYHDAVEDDARLALAVARTAIREGAVVATRVRALSQVRERGRVTALRVRDEATGTELEIRTSAVVDATGAAGELAGGGLPPAVLAPSRGTHLVVRRDRIPVPHGLALRVAGRVVFVIPWHDCWIVGTTDVPHAGPTDRPAATTDEVDYLFEALAAALAIRLEPDDIVATYAGIRPLVASGGRSTLQTSREHRVERTGDGVIQVRGGKYTTYRLMAADAVDAVLGDAARARPSRTGDLLLVGALDEVERPAVAAELERTSGLERDVVDQLLGRHGREAGAVVALGRELDLLRPLAPGHRYLEAEVAWAAREELALSLDDVLARRTRLALETLDHGAGAGPRVAAILGAALGWSPAEILGAPGRYEVGAAREYGLPVAAASRPLPEVA
jgi:glycerol-3-phosphate dehydrogenase